MIDPRISDKLARRRADRLLRALPSSAEVLRSLRTAIVTTRFRASDAKSVTRAKGILRKKRLVMDAGINNGSAWAVSLSAADGTRSNTATGTSFEDEAVVAWLAVSGRKPTAVYWTKHAVIRGYDRAGFLTKTDAQIKAAIVRTSRWLLWGGTIPEGLQQAIFHSEETGTAVVFEYIKLSFDDALGVVVKTVLSGDMLTDEEMAYARAWGDEEEMLRLAPQRYRTPTKRN